MDEYKIISNTILWGCSFGFNYMAINTKEYHGRLGIYICETSRSLAERRGEHHTDNLAFSKKSHVIKHWMTSHRDLQRPPAFKIKIMRRYRDCLSRQLVEGTYILLSMETLLNSKYYYIQNCISRITVHEEMLEGRQDLPRKKRRKESCKKKLEDSSQGRD